MAPQFKYVARRPWKAHYGAVLGNSCAKALSPVGDSCEKALSPVEDRTGFIFPSARGGTPAGVLTHSIDLPCIETGDRHNTCVCLYFAAQGVVGSFDGSQITELNCAQTANCMKSTEAILGTVH